MFRFARLGSGVQLGKLGRVRLPRPGEVGLRLGLPGGKGLDLRFEGGHGGRFLPARGFQFSQMFRFARLGSGVQLGKLGRMRIPCLGVFCLKC